MTASAFAYCPVERRWRYLGHPCVARRRSTTHAATGKAAPSNPRPVSPLTGRGTTRDEKAAKA